MGQKAAYPGKPYFMTIISNKFCYLAAALAAASQAFHLS